MKRFLTTPAAALSLLLVPVAYSHAKKTPEQYWQETGFTPQVVVEGVNFLEPASCMIKVENFRGCVGAINAVGGMADSALQLIPSSVKGEAGFGSVVREFGDFSLVTVLEDTSQDTFRVKHARSVERRKRVEAAIAQVFAQRTTQDFEPIFLETVSIAVKDPSREAQAAGAAFNGFVREAIDGHARVQPTAELNDNTSNADENFVGIGARLESINGESVVVSPIDGSPALRAGIRANDVILGVDGKSMAGKKLEDVVKLIRGIEGTTVKLRIRRGEKEIELDIVRARIVQPNLEAKIVSEFGQKVLHIRLRSFMDDKGCLKIGQSIEQAGSVDGIVLDFRENGGGLLNEAVCIGGLFLGRKVVVKVKSLDNDLFRDSVSFQDQITRAPLVVLIDAGSASASEVVSGAIQDHQRGWILGERSFGKGSVQRGQSLGQSPLTMFRTIERFYQPSGRTNQIVGISPDFEVPMKPDATADERFRLREGDIFPNALGAVGPVWKQTRPQDVSRVSDCVASGSLAKKAYAAKKAGNEAPDYQLLAAIEVLSCDR